MEKLLCILIIRVNDHIIKVLNIISLDKLPNLSFHIHERKHSLLLHISCSIISPASARAADASAYCSAVMAGDTRWAIRWVHPSNCDRSACGTPSSSQITSEGTGGSLWLKQGDPVHAEAKGLLGFDAAMSLVTVTSGSFSFEPKLEVPDATIEASVTQLLLEASRLKDEENF